MTYKKKLIEVARPLDAINKASRVHYVRRPFRREPDVGVTSVNYECVPHDRLGPPFSDVGAPRSARRATTKRIGAAAQRAARKCARGHTATAWVNSRAHLRPLRGRCVAPLHPGKNDWRKVPAAGHVGHTLNYDFSDLLQRAEAPR